MDKVPYLGAVKRVLTKKEMKAEKKANKKKKVTRGKVVCTCGQLALNFTALPRYHDNDCIINKEK